MHNSSFLDFKITIAMCPFTSTNYIMSSVFFHVLFWIISVCRTLLNIFLFIFEFSPLETVLPFFSGLTFYIFYFILTFNLSIFRIVHTPAWVFLCKSFSGWIFFQKTLFSLFGLNKISEKIYYLVFELEKNN